MRNLKYVWNINFAWSDLIVGRSRLRLPRKIFRLSSPGSSLSRVVVLCCQAKQFAFTMLLSLSSQLYGYLPTNGQENLGNVWWDDEEGKGSTFDEHPMRPLGELSLSANFSFLCMVRLFFVLSRFLLFSVKHIDTAASYQGDDKHAACRRQNQWTNKVSIFVASVEDTSKPLASYFAILYE